MTEIGRRPSLTELLGILGAVTRIEADPRAQQLDQPAFSVTLTFHREQLRLNGILDWVEGEPKPMWLFDGVVEYLTRWAVQCAKEQEWADGEKKHGASLDSVMSFLTSKMVEAESRRRTGGPVVSLQGDVDKKLYANAILRLQELKARKEASGIKSDWERRREQANRAWMDDEINGLNREAEQKRQREQTAGPDFNDGAKAYRDFFTQYAEGMFEDTLFGRFTGRGANRPPPVQPARMAWYAVLDCQPDAPPDVVKKAYRRLARKYHPDVSKEIDAKVRFQDINAAWMEFKQLRGLT